MTPPTLNATADTKEQTVRIAQPQAKHGASKKKKKPQQISMVTLHGVHEGVNPRWTRHTSTARGLIFLLCEQLLPTVDNRQTNVCLHGNCGSGTWARVVPLPPGKRLLTMTEPLFSLRPASTSPSKYIKLLSHAGFLGAGGIMGSEVLKVYSSVLSAGAHSAALTGCL